MTNTSKIASKNKTILRKHRYELNIVRQEITPGEYKPTVLDFTYGNCHYSDDVYHWNQILPRLCEELFKIYGDHFVNEAASDKFLYLSNRLPQYQESPHLWERMKGCHISIFKTRSAAEIIGKSIELMTHFSDNEDGVLVRLVTI